LKWERNNIPNTICSYSLDSPGAWFPMLALFSVLLRRVMYGIMIAFQYSNALYALDEILRQIKQSFK